LRRGAAHGVLSVRRQATVRVEHDRRCGRGDELIIELQRAYVERFSPGIDERVNAPHEMEPAIPDVIVEKLRFVIDQAAD
jgi:hypothetical protein